MATFSDGTEPPPINTEFKPTRGSRHTGIEQHKATNEYSSNCIYAGPQSHVYNNRIDYYHNDHYGDNYNDYYGNNNYNDYYGNNNHNDYYRDNKYNGNDVYEQYSQYSGENVYATSHGGGYNGGGERGGTRGRKPRGRRGRGTKWRTVEGARFVIEREVHPDQLEWGVNEADSPKKNAKKKWRKEHWEDRQFSNRRNSNRGNWRNTRERFVSDFTPRGRHEDIEWSERIKGATVQTEELTQQIVDLSYECVVCCEIVEHKQSVWSCQECYQLFHLSCVVKWATAPNSLADCDHPENGWKCPTCRHTHLQVPDKYICFCGEVSAYMYSTIILLIKGIALHI
ncbi:Transcriptional repressor NF-X1 [Oopsacas minuta]|uniref:Transcriptional repressor NF-X1 n=1 Tax=Oopsacas minuta TaxID=111878 RepID=A0AAV7JL90_9METZ|nr:Transcriptional repressor NF-X1 [Oopsacas minuta]